MRAFCRFARFVFQIPDTLAHMNEIGRNYMPRCGYGRTHAKFGKIVERLNLNFIIFAHLCHIYIHMHPYGKTYLRQICCSYKYMHTLTHLFVVAIDTSDPHTFVTQQIERLRWIDRRTICLVKKNRYLKLQATIYELYKTECIYSEILNKSIDYDFLVGGVCICTL